MLFFSSNKVLPDYFDTKVVQIERRTKEFTLFYPETQPILVFGTKVETFSHSLVEFALIYPIIRESETKRCLKQSFYASSRR